MTESQLYTNISFQLYSINILMLLPITYLES